jgi:hypothetical protein
MTVRRPPRQSTDSLRDRKWKEQAFYDANRPTGATGPQGPAGPQGQPNSLAIGSVVSGSTPSATIVGAAPSQTLNLVLPQGAEGPPGVQGAQGPQGEKGDPGDTVAFEFRGGEPETNYQYGPAFDCGDVV